MNTLKRVTYNLPEWIVKELDNKAQKEKDDGNTNQKSASFELRKILEKSLKPKRKSTPKPPAVIEDAMGHIPCTNGEYPVTQSDVDTWAAAYPAVNIGLELNAIVAWLDANETKKKTVSGAKRFINAWLSKTQNKGGNNGNLQAGYASNNKETITAVDRVRSAFAERNDQGY